MATLDVSRAQRIRPGSLTLVGGGYYRFKRKKPHNLRKTPILVLTCVFILARVDYPPLLFFTVPVLRCFRYEHLQKFKYPLQNIVCRDGWMDRLSRDLSPGSGTDERY